MLNLLTLFLPEEALLPLMVISGILIMVGFRRIGFRIFGMVILLAFLTPFYPVLGSIIANLPPEVFWPLMAVFSFLIFRTVFIALFGRRVWEHVLARFLYNALGWPFRLMGWLFFWPLRRR